MYYIIVSIPLDKEVVEAQANAIAEEVTELITDAIWTEDYVDVDDMIVTVQEEQD